MDRKSRLVDKKCRICGKTFTGIYYRSYCGGKCTKSSKLTIIKLVCRECNKEFGVKPDKERLYCSLKCCESYMRNKKSVTN